MSYNGSYLPRLPEIFSLHGDGLSPSQIESKLGGARISKATIRDILIAEGHTPNRSYDPAVTKARRERIIEMSRSGMTVQMIANALPWNWTNVATVLKAAGLFEAKPAPSAEERASRNAEIVAARRDAGATRLDLQRIFDLSSQGVLNILNDAGCDMSAPPPLRDREKVQELFRSHGMEPEEVRDADDPSVVALDAAEAARMSRRNVSHGTLDLARKKFLEEQSRTAQSEGRQKRVCGSCGRDYWALGRSAAVCCGECRALSAAARRARKHGSLLKCLPGFPAERQFQTMEEANEYLSGEKITCLICGHPYKGLYRHLEHAHDMSADDYRDRFGLPPSCGLVGEKLRELLVANGRAEYERRGEDAYKAMQELSFGVPKSLPNLVPLRLAELRAKGAAMHLSEKHISKLAGSRFPAICNGCGCDIVVDGMAALTMPDRLLCDGCAADRSNAASRMWKERNSRRYAEWHDAWMHLVRKLDDGPLLEYADRFPSNRIDWDLADDYLTGKRSPGNGRPRTARREMRQRESLSNPGNPIEMSPKSESAAI